MDANAPTETASGQKPPPVTPRAVQARPAAVRIPQPVTPGYLARAKHDEIDSGQKTASDHDVTVHGKRAIEASNDHPVLDRLTANGKQRERQWRDRSREPSDRKRPYYPPMLLQPKLGKPGRIAKGSSPPKTLSTHHLAGRAVIRGKRGEPTETGQSRQ